MNINDFRYMYRGRPVSRLSPNDVGLLDSVANEGTGRERALLLLHGFSSSPAVFRRLIPRLTMYDTIICPILPGHAECIDVFANVNADEWVVCAEQACEQLIRNYPYVDVLGLSLGGVLANHLATRYQLNHLYLLAPAFNLQLNISFVLQLVKVLHWFGFTRLRNFAGNLCSNTHPELAYCQVPLSALIQILAFIKTFPWTPPVCPVDVFLGRHDKVVDSDAVASRFSELPKAHVHWLEHSAHVLPLDNDVDDLLGYLRETRP